jgi:hypothetical protein
MATRRDVAAEQIRGLTEDLKRLAQAVSHDPKKQARKERGWRILNTVSTVVFTLVARRVAARVWGVVTGERPPTKK